MYEILRTLLGVNNCQSGANKMAAHYDPSKCAKCECPFEKGKRGYKRTKLIQLTSPGTAYRFCQRTVHLDNFICSLCKKDLVKHTVRNKSSNSKNERMKRIYPGKHAATRIPAAGTKKRVQAIPLPQLNSLKKETGCEEELDTEDEMSNCEINGEGTSQTKTPRPIKHVFACFAKKRYETGMRALLKVSPRVKVAFIRVMVDVIRQEMKQKPKLNAFEQDVNETTVSSFSWEGALEEASQSMPAAVHCIRATLPFKRNGKNKSVLTRKAGQMLAISLYARDRKRYNFVQALIGMEMWRQRVSLRAFITLNRMGISQGMRASSRRVDVVGKEHDKKLLTWKESQEKPQSGGKGRWKVQGKPHTYGFCINNIQIGMETKPQTRGHSILLMSQTVCFAVEDRVKDAIPQTQVAASKLDPYAFLPSPDVFERQRSRAVFIVEQVLTTHVSKLKHLKNRMPSRILHAHTKEMDENSQYVTLGVVDADPGSIEGMTMVMEHLQKYVPVVQDTPTPCLLSGGGQTVECVLYAQRACSDGERWEDRLEALYACPQESHKEVLHMQASNDRFFNESSLANRGTVAQLQKEFNHRQFKKNVMGDVQHVWDFYKFVTESHILLCALKLCGLTSLTDKPEGLPKGWHTKEQLKWVNNLAQRVVDFCWAPPDRGDVAVAAAAFDEQVKDVPDEALRFCVCQSTEKSEEVVLCCAKTCRHAWFHLSCVGLSEAPDSSTDWYCSVECEQSESYNYCFCHKQRADEDEEMVQCHLAEDCKKYGWYHKSCINIGKDDPVPEQWYCTEDCELGAEQDDDVLNHTKALLYEGLCHLVRRQAVREGDGPAMVDDWRADMVTFYNMNDPKYLINGHYFLACVGGFADPKLQESLMWNRLANPTGKPGGNVGLHDLVNEHFNSDYTGMLRSSGGGITPKDLTRCAQMNGPFGRALDNTFTCAGLVDMGESTGEKRTEMYNKDIERFTVEFQPDGLFDYIPGRQHVAFGAFDVNQPMENPKKLGQELQHLSENLDMWKNRNCSDENT